MTGDGVSPAEATVLSEPRPLPSVPCLTYMGARVVWGAWERAPRLSCIDNSCEVCSAEVAAAICRGITDDLQLSLFDECLPQDGEQ